MNKGWMGVEHLSLSSPVWNILWVIVELQDEALLNYWELLSVCIVGSASSPETWTTTNMHRSCTPACIWETDLKNKTTKKEPQNVNMEWSRETQRAEQYTENIHTFKQQHERPQRGDLQWCLCQTAALHLRGCLLHERSLDAALTTKQQTMGHSDLWPIISVKFKGVPMSQWSSMAHRNKMSGFSHCI